ncbi:MAG: hypothetical protein WAW00_02100 [Candidatus Moraniibacteriota bacterium]
MKKTFYISVGLLILVLIFLAAYNFAFRNNVNDPVADPEKKASSEEAASSDTAPIVTNIQPLINEDILGATISTDGTIYYYSIDDQALKKASLAGKDKSVLMSNLPGMPLRVTWSPQKDKALLLLKQQSGQSLWHFADLATKTLVPLRPEMLRLTWNNLGDKIFYQYTDPRSGEQSLNISNPDGSSWKKLAFLYRDSFIAPIPQSTTVSFWGKPNALEKTYFETVSLTGENRRTLLSEKFGADYLWSPDGEKVLVSISEEKGGHGVVLNIMNGSGGEFQGLSIPTLVSKAVWAKDGKTVYYALPGSLPESALLPNDYFDKPLNTKDTFWKVDTTTGKKTRLADLKEVTKSFDSTDLFLSPQEDALFFTDRVTHRLYRIDF